MTGERLVHWIRAGMGAAMPDVRRLSRDPGWWLFAIALLALAGWSAWDHVSWVKQDHSPLLFGDSPLHLVGVAEAWRGYNDSPWWSLQVSYGTYPPGLYFVALPLFGAMGMSSEAFRIAGAAYTVLLVLGSGIFGARVFGRMAGLAAAAVVLTYPEIWVQRAEVQMDLPLAGAAIFAFALLPSPRRPGTPWLALAGGLAMTWALWTKQAMLPIAGAGMAWLVLEAVVRWLRARRRVDPGPALRHLRDVAICSAPVLLLGGYYYVRAYPILNDAMSHIWDSAEIPQGRDWVLAKLGLLAWLKHVFIPAPHCWAMLAGILCLPWIWRRRPLLGPLIAGLAAGLYEFLIFPNPHERHFVPLVPMFLMISVAPLGLLRGARWRRLFQVPLVLVAVTYGLVFTWSWREPGWEPATARMRARGGEFGAFERPDSFSWVVRYLVARPESWWAFAPMPDRADWSQSAVIDALRADWPDDGSRDLYWYGLPHNHDRRALVLVRDGFPPDLSFFAEAVMHREYRFHFQGLGPGDLSPYLAQLRQQGLPQAGVYLLIAAREREGLGQARTEAEAEGFRLLEGWNWSLTEHGEPYGVLLYRLAGPS